MGTTEERLQNLDFQNTNFGSENYCFDTLALHAGLVADPSTGAMLPPIYQTTTYRQEAVGKDKGFTYSRSGNPTVSALERRLAALEGAEFCTCYATGLAATTALCLALLRSGDRVVCSQAVYGGTVRLFQQVLGPFGVVADFVDTADESVLRKSLAEKPTRFVFVETPANPTLKLTDIEVTARLAHVTDGVILRPRYDQLRIRNPEHVGFGSAAVVPIVGTTRPERFTLPREIVRARSRVSRHVGADLAV